MDGAVMTSRRVRQEGSVVEWWTASTPSLPLCWCVGRRTDGLPAFTQLGHPHSPLPTLSTNPTPYSCPRSSVLPLHTCRLPLSHDLLHMKRVRTLLLGGRLPHFPSCLPPTFPQPSAHFSLHCSSPLILSLSPPSRFFASRSGVAPPRVRRSKSRRDPSETHPDDPTMVTPEVARQRREKEKERVLDVERRQLAFNAYNKDLILRVKACEDWAALLPLLAKELSTTEYNEASSQRC